MRRTEVLQENRKMRFEETYEGWNAGRLTQFEAARILGMRERSFRRYLLRYEAEGLEGLIDRRLEQVSHRRAPVDEVIALTEQYRTRHSCHYIKVKGSVYIAMSAVIWHCFMGHANWLIMTRKERSSHRN
jgi:hypothetical protein